MANNHDNGNSGSPTEELKPAAEVAEYWTEERRRAAKPYPMPKGHAGKEQAGKEQAQQLPKGEEGHTSHGHGSEKQASTHSGTFDPKMLGTPVPNPLLYPFRVIGKIYFNQAGGSYSASAALVSPNVLLTAGHCVYGSGKWSTNMVFYPSYGKRASNDPLNHVACGKLACRTSYTQNYNHAHDYGMAWMPTGPGNTLGWFGLAWNQSTTGRRWEAFGYPATPNPPFNGDTLCESIGTYVHSSESGVIGLSDDNMEHGSSGGPWVTSVSSAENPWVHANGLQSFHIHDGDHVEYGPYFTDEVKSLFDYINANH